MVYHRMDEKFLSDAEKFRLGYYRGHKFKLAGVTAEISLEKKRVLREMAKVKGISLSTLVGRIVDKFMENVDE